LHTPLQYQLQNRIVATNTGHYADLSVFTFSHKASNFVFSHIDYCDAPISLNARLKRFRGRDSEGTPLLSKVSSGRKCRVHSRPVFLNLCETAAR